MDALSPEKLEAWGHRMIEAAATQKIVGNDRWLWPDEVHVLRLVVLHAVHEWHRGVSRRQIDFVGAPVTAAFTARLDALCGAMVARLAAPAESPAEPPPPPPAHVPPADRRAMPVHVRRPRGPRVSLESLRVAALRRRVLV